MHKWFQTKLQLHLSFPPPNPILFLIFWINWWNNKLMLEIFYEYHSLSCILALQDLKKKFFFNWQYISKNFYCITKLYKNGFWKIFSLFLSQSLKECCLLFIYSYLFLKFINIFKHKKNICKPQTFSVLKQKSWSYKIGGGGS